MQSLQGGRLSPLLLAVTSLALLLGLPAAGAVPASAPFGARASAPTARTLANGLKVYVLKDASSPNVAVQVWYGVGSKDDPEGRSGFAHLFEHMMFKASRDMPAEFMDRLTEDVGGSNNATTADDYTNFFEVAPANQLDRLLWAEAERMSSLTVDAAAFASERSVVEEELRQSYLANPYGRLALAIRDAAYDRHPYRRSTIGSIGDLEAAGLADVRAFHDVFYRPDNAALIIIGNVDPLGVDRAVDALFGPIGRPNTALPVVLAREPAHDAPRTRTVYAPGVPLPAADIAWTIPGAASADLPALRVADALLSAGDASRLNHDLVYAAQIAQSAASDAGQNRDPSLFQVQAVAAAGHTALEAQSALLKEIDRLRTGLASPEELRRAKNQLIAQALMQGETLEGRGFEIGRALLLEGDAGRAAGDVARLEAVTAQDVRRVARLYLDPRRRTSLLYLDESARPKGTPPAADLAQISPKVEAVALTRNVVAAPPPASLPHAPPPAGPLIDGTPPAVEARTLGNGLLVLIARNPAVPLATAELSVRRGAAADPDGRFGLASLTTDLLTRGTRTRSASEIARTIESAGGSLRSETGYDRASLTLTVLARELPATLPVLADVARRPAFAADELERLRRQKIDDLSVALKEPGPLADALAGPLVFGAGPYGQVLEGSPASLLRLSRADVLNAYGAAFRPDEAVLVITGDVTPNEGFALAEEAFGDWAVAGPPAPVGAPAPAAAGAGGPRVIAVDLPGAGQAAVVLAAATVGREDPRYYAVRAANAVLGGGFSSRLNEEVRVKRGLSYGASSRIEGRRGASLFLASAQTKNASAGEVAELLIKTADALNAAPLPDEELKARLSALLGGYGRLVDTGSGLADVASLDAVEGLGPGEVAAYPRRIADVSAGEAKAAAGLLIDPARLVVVVVGDGAAMLPGLKTRFKTLETVSAARLDLSTSSLGLAEGPAS